ncbi:MAG: CPBP family intramembrane glutamic endopeptidase [Oscillospiraceae bacterium]
MENNKKLTIKRLIIFFVLAFAPLCIIAPILNAYYGEPIYISTNPQAQNAVFVFSALAMFTPAVANLLTRLITKEGFSKSYLGLTVGKHPGWFAASIIIKLVESAITVALICAVFLGDMSFDEIFTSDNASLNFAAVVSQLGYSLVLFFPAFGEEWGWRGYMMPKLTELMGKPAAVIVGGVIWGLWHAPLTVSGHNFGTDYDFFPWTGILIMCLLCTLMNAFLTLLTERTNSIYPASFAHMVNNNLSTSVLLITFCSAEAINRLNELGTIKIGFFMLITTAVTGIVSFILLIRDKKKAE